MGLASDVSLRRDDGPRLDELHSGRDARPITNNNGSLPVRNSVIFAAMWLSATAGNANAQDVIQTYEQARDTFFWDVLYKDGGETLYCGQAFSSHTGLSVEHVYPAGWIASHFGCFNRDTCPVDAYHHAAADLHNLWPARADINRGRSNLHFGSIAGESNRIRTGVCPDFERVGSSNDGIAEPRDEAKGEIARSMFYMELAYGLPLGRMRKMLLQWDERDPVSEEELRRNGEIAKIQKRRNPFIGRIEGGELKRLEPTRY